MGYIIEIVGLENMVLMETEGDVSAVVVLHQIVIKVLLYRHMFFYRSLRSSALRCSSKTDLEWTVVAS